MKVYCLFTLELLVLLELSPKCELKSLPFRFKGLYRVLRKRLLYRSGSEIFLGLP